jgi:hypothetical protein
MIGATFFKEGETMNRRNFLTLAAAAPAAAAAARLDLGRL